MSTKMYACTQCSAENYAWKDTCYKCKKWATGEEKTYWKKRSSSGKRRESQEKKLFDDKNMEEIAKKVAAIMTKAEQGGSEDSKQTAPTKPTKAPLPSSSSAHKDTKTVVNVESLKEEDKKTYSKLTKSLENKQKMLKQLLEEDDDGSPTILSLRSDILNIQEKIEKLQPMEDRISVQTEKLQAMQKRQAEIQSEMQSLREEHQQLEKDITATKNELDSLQTQYHDNKVPQGFTHNMAAISLAVQRGDAELYKLLTGLELKIKLENKPAAAVGQNQLPKQPPQEAELAGTAPGAAGYGPASASSQRQRSPRRVATPYGDPTHQGAEAKTGDAGNARAGSVPPTRGSVFQDAVINLEDH
eukprot:TRINITY_DN50791_c0_g1_i1.p2 TRINITY_DN50791_c0_g1~~TRINITY_DN50791_c0_g1_i1.p2  ORF type:complete len:358 (-),score=122.73 TRINITY_DN50791_c0_g1_i1:494-1567(-)